MNNRNAQLHVQLNQNKRSLKTSKNQQTSTKVIKGGMYNRGVKKIVAPSSEVSSVVTCQNITRHTIERHPICIVPHPRHGMFSEPSFYTFVFAGTTPFPALVQVSSVTEACRVKSCRVCKASLQQLGKLWLLWWMLNPNSHTAQAVLFCTRTIPLLFKHSRNFWLPSHSLKSGLYSLNIPAVSLARFSALVVETIAESWRRKLQATATASKMT